MVKTVKKIVEEYKKRQNMAEKRELLSFVNKQFDERYWTVNDMRVQYIDYIIEQFDNEEKKIFVGHYFENKTHKDFYMSESTYYYHIRKLSKKFIDQISDWSLATRVVNI